MSIIRHLRFVFGLLATSIILSSGAFGKIALVSTDKESFNSFHLAEEAIQAGARIIVFPEWGFLPQPDIATSILADWSRFASDYKVYVVLGVRYTQRNTMAVFSPNGGRYLAFRRDGHNSIPPSEPMYQKPLIIDTEFGRIGFLICDESRQKKFLDEIGTYNPQFIIAINKIGFGMDEASLLQRAHQLGYSRPLYSVDTLSLYGHQTYAFFPDRDSVALNDLGTPRQFNDISNLKTDPQGMRYLISLFDIPTNP